jgi:hypothetical protein
VGATEAHTADAGMIRICGSSLPGVAQDGGCLLLNFPPNPLRVFGKPTVVLVSAV